MRVRRGPRSGGLYSRAGMPVGRDADRVREAVLWGERWFLDRVVLGCMGVEGRRGGEWVVEEDEEGGEAR